MTSGAANATQADRRVLAVTILAGSLALLAGGAAAWRWERHPDLVPGLPAPVGSRQLESERGVGRRADVCRFLVVARGDLATVMGRYEAALATRGWIPTVASAAAPRRYSRNNQTLTLAGNERVQEPGWTRLRLQLRPCR